MTIIEQRIFGYMRNHNKEYAPLKEILVDCSTTATGVDITNYKLTVLKPAVVSLSEQGVLESVDKLDGTYYRLTKKWKDVDC